MGLIHHEHHVEPREQLEEIGLVGGSRGVAHQQQAPTGDAAVDAVAVPSSAAGSPGRHPGAQARTGLAFPGVEAGQRTHDDDQVDGFRVQVGGSDRQGRGGLARARDGEVGGVHGGHRDRDRLLLVRSERPLPAHGVQRGRDRAEVEDRLSGPELLRGGRGSLEAAPSGELSLHRGGSDLAVRQVDVVAPGQEPVVGLEHQGMHRAVASRTRPARLEPSGAQKTAEVQGRSAITQ